MYRRTKLDAQSRSATNESRTADPSRRSLLAAGAFATAAATLSTASFAQSIFPSRASQTRFRRIPTQFIAALGEPDATSGDNAQLWGLWRQDPGPRGVTLSHYDRLVAAGGVAPAGWKFDSSDWWLEEHGLIMEAPEFPMPPGMYMVTGNRAAKAVLTVQPAQSDGTQHWELDNGATLYDVTHLACRSARYTHGASGGSCSPTRARMADFPVSPGAEMPPVESCAKQDYTVLIVLGVAVED